MWKGAAHRGQNGPTLEGVCRPGAGKGVNPLTGADGLKRGRGEVRR